MEGWICLHRQILDWEWYLEPNTLRVFLHLLLKANHEDNKWQGILVERGQLVTSLNHLSKELKLSIQQTRTSLNRLKSTHEITINSTSKHTLVTIVNYDLYQSNDKKITNTITHNVTNEQQTNNKQITTNNNDNNDNNIYINLFNKYKKDIDRKDFGAWIKANRKLKEDEDYYKLSREEQDKLFNY